MAEKIKYTDLFDPRLQAEIKQLEEQLKALDKTVSDLSKQTVNIKISSKQTGEAYAKNKKAAEELDLATKQINETYKQKKKIEQQLLQVQAKAVLQSGDKAQQLLKEREQLKKLTFEMRQNAKAATAQKGSIEALEAETNKLVRERKKLDRTSQKGAKEFARLTQEIAKNTAELKELDSQIGRHQRNVGNYQSALEGVRGVFTKLVGGAGLIAGAIAGFAGLSRTLSQTNKLQNRIRLQFGATGDQLERMTASVKTLSTIYEKDYEEVLNSANALSKEFGISGQQSLALINEGFEKGADNTGEFLDILREYSVQMRSAGIDSEQFISVITQQVNSGVFSDKGIDSIKEAAISLREMTPATKEALEGIGLASDEIQQSLQDGTASSLDIIKQVSARLDELGEQAPGVGTAIADIFRGAGEDAGFRYLTTLKDIGTELDSLPSQTNRFAEATKELTSQWNLLTSSILTGDNFVNTALANIFDFFGDATQQLRILITEGAFAGQEILKLVEQFEELAEVSETGISAFGFATLELESLVELGGTEEEINNVVKAIKELNTGLQDTSKFSENQIKILKDYGIELGTNTEEVEDNTQATEQQNFVKQRQIDILSAAIEPIKAETLGNRDLAISVDNVVNSLKAIIAERERLAKLEEEEARKAAREKLIARLQEFTDLGSEFTGEVINGLQKVADADLQYTEELISNSEQRINSLQSELDKQLELKEQGAANNADALQKEIEAEKQALAEQERIREQALRKQKRLRIASITVDYFTELAKISLYAASNIVGNAFTGGAYAAGVIALQGGIATSRYLSNLAAINAQQFATGTEYVELNGARPGIDTVPALLTEGERVLTVQQNKVLGEMTNEQLVNAANIGAMLMENSAISPTDGFDTGLLLASKLDQSNSTLQNIESNTGYRETVSKTGQRVTYSGHKKTVK